MTAGLVPPARLMEIPGPTSHDRLAYVAALLGIEMSAMPLSAQEGHLVTWAGSSAFHREIERIREEILHKYAMLLRQMIDWARQQGCSIVRLWSSAARTHSHRFYERLGYTNIKTQYSFIKSLDAAGHQDVKWFVPRVEQ
jgi:hypothetical protein